MTPEKKIVGEVEQFPQKGGWYYVAAPKWMSTEFASLAERGLIAIRATVGNVTWDTSLLPKGDGSHFVALNTKVRRANDLAIGDQVKIFFELRKR